MAAAALGLDHGRTRTSFSGTTQISVLASRGKREFPKRSQILGVPVAFVVPRLTLSLEATPRHPHFSQTFTWGSRDLG